jgi:hypothetical protein
MRRLLFLFCLPFLLIATEAPAFTQNKGAYHDITVPETPLEVGVGIEIQQITSVEQTSENFGAVATIYLEWTDPKLGFDADAYSLPYRLFSPEDFADYLKERQTYAPEFVIQNQQGNRWIHQSLIAVAPDGNARYAEKSALTLQAPYFNFRRYPFDRQVFYLEVVSTFPENFVSFTALEDQSGLGPLLGEEEWVLRNARMLVSSAKGLTGQTSAKAALQFTGHRHIQYYATRIFLPMLILVAVSWAAFFLEEYRKRAEIAGANLLVFVAFNWAISDDLPRLGYLTFLDFILQWMFVVTGLIIVFNVWLTRLQVSGRETLAAKLDGYVMRWIYPLGYAAIVGFAVVRYLVVA